MLTMPTGTSKGYAMAALVSLTLAAVLAIALYWGTYFGNVAAATALMTLSLPQYNPFAALIPEDLSQSRWGLELLLGVVILQGAVVMFALYSLWSLLRRRRPREQ